MPLVWIIVAVVVLALLLLSLAIRVVKQYEQGVLFRLGRVIGVRPAGLTVIIPFVDVLHRVSLRIITMPIQSQGIITRDNVSVDVSAVAYYRVVDPVKSVVAIENVAAAINQIAQTTLRKVVGQHTLDQTLSETDQININIREILDVATEEWGVVVTLVELKDIQLPDSMKRAAVRDGHERHVCTGLSGGVAGSAAVEPERLGAHPTVSIDADGDGVIDRAAVASRPGISAAAPAGPGHRGDRTDTQWKTAHFHIYLTPDATPRAA